MFSPPPFVGKTAKEKRKFFEWLDVPAKLIEGRNTKRRKRRRSQHLKRSHPSAPKKQTLARKKSKGVEECPPFAALQVVSKKASDPKPAVSEKKGQTPAQKAAVVVIVSGFGKISFKRGGLLKKRWAATNLGIPAYNLMDLLRKTKKEELAALENCEKIILVADSLAAADEAMKRLVNTIASPAVTLLGTGRKAICVDPAWCREIFKMKSFDISTTIPFRLDRFAKKVDSISHTIDVCEARKRVSNRPSHDLVPENLPASSRTALGTGTSGSSSQLPKCVSWSLHFWRHEADMLKKIRRAFMSRHNMACERSGVVETRSINESIAAPLSELETIYKALGDEWRANGYKKASDIVKRWPRRISRSCLPLIKKKYRGFGPKILKRVEEVIEHAAECRRRGVVGEDFPLLRELKKNRNTLAIMELSTVWGIGPSTARLLCSKGLFSVSDLLRECENKRINLSHGQRIGLKYFDDLNSRIPRAEVGRIRNCVQEAAVALCNDAIAVTCGSYRRGKATCGDVDILLCSPALDTGLQMVHFMSKLIKKLKAVAFLVDDLTPEFETSYMGVCILPEPNALHRHIDIKIYPKEQFSFAQLYFTGSDHFNRSMRHYANRIGWTLGDRGLFPAQRHSGNRSGKKTVLGASITATSEQDIFDALGLQFRLPEQRNCYEEIMIEEEEEVVSDGETPERCRPVLRESENENDSK